MRPLLVDRVHLDSKLSGKREIIAKFDLIDDDTTLLPAPTHFELGSITPTAH